MTKISGSNLFKNPTKWPVIPPWWLLSSPQVAALLSVTSATLHNWRVRDEGPDSVPPMYLRKTQGDPVYYMYGAIRMWAAERLGLNYPMEDQSRDFFESVDPNFNSGTGTWRGRANAFNLVFAEAHRDARNGKKSFRFTLEQIQQLDIYYSRQPRQLQPILKAKLPLCLSSP